MRQWVLTFPKLGRIRSLLDQCSFAPMLKQVPLSRSRYGDLGPWSTADVPNASSK